MAHSDPTAIVRLQQKQEAKWLCSACGADRGCDCNAPAVEKLAEKLEQDRQRARRARERIKAEQNQQPRHVTQEKERYVSPVAAGKATLPEFYTANHVIGILEHSIHDLSVLDFPRAARGCDAADVERISQNVERLSGLLDQLRTAMGLVTNGHEIPADLSVPTFMRRA